MNYTPKRASRALIFLIVGFGILIAAVVAYQVPSVRSRIIWRVERAVTFARGLIDPVRPIPTASGKVDAGFLTAEPTLTQTPMPTGTALPRTATPLERMTPSPVPPTFTPTALPARVVLQTSGYEKQDINNCGPATLSMYLRFYGWDGDQFDISDVIKPIPQDRNVNVEELLTYLRTQAGGFESEYRVGGDIDLLRRLIAAGFPVVIEESMRLDESYWLNDDRWAGHYLLLTGYDDGNRIFFTQDSYRGPDVAVPYDTLDRNWHTFNRVYLLVYPPDAHAQIQSILGNQWDMDLNRQHALEVARQETNEDSTDSYAWFNLGSNLVYFEKYQEAAAAYDTARSLGLPQRMLRYQFGPFFAYFHTGRNEDLLSLAEYALERTPNAEEAMLWKGWAMYRLGKVAEAQALFSKALEARPGYPDAQYGLNFILGN